MLSVIIPTQESERALLPTLAALVPGAAAGLVREVIVADAGSRDATAEVADVAGCRFIASGEPLAARLAAAARGAKAEWLMFLRPGIRLEADWVADVSRFLELAELADVPAPRAAVFRPTPASLGGRRLLIEALALVAAGLRGPKADQGLLIAKQFYQQIGGHRAGGAEPEEDLLHRLGRRRIAILRSGAIRVRV